MKSRGFQKICGNLRESAAEISHAAFSLIEVVIALGIFSFVVVAILGTMTVALNSTRDGEMKLRASHVGAMILGTVKANPTNRTDTSLFPYGAYSNLNSLSTTDERSGIYVDRQGRSVASARDANAAFQLAWKMTRDAQVTNLVYCYLDMSWPPAAPSNSVKGTHRVAGTVLLPQ